MKIAIFGGSFNPLHAGHAMLADTIIRELGYDKILFVPTCIPPHKELSEGATTKNRLEMVKAFCDSEEKGFFELEPCEIERGGVSYTIDTVNFIIEKYKNQLSCKPALLMGEEIAAEFSKWKDPDKISELCDLIIVPRYPDFFGRSSTAFQNSALGKYKGDFKVTFDKSNFGYPCKVLDIPILTVSSTEIRARISTKRSFKYLLPPAVYEYIVTNNLYK